MEPKWITKLRENLCCCEEGAKCISCSTIDDVVADMPEAQTGTMDFWEWMDKEGSLKDTLPNIMGLACHKVNGGQEFTLMVAKLN